MQQNRSAFSLTLALSRRRAIQAGLATLTLTLAPSVAGRARAAQTEATPAPLPGDALPQDQQVLRTMGREGRYLDWSKSVQQRQFESALITEPLVRRNENYELVPAGAESWDISDDNLTWTFHLRPGMTWSDGTPVTAEDYAYTVRRMADPNTAFDVTFYYGSIKNFTAASEGKAPVDEVGVAAIDDLTLAITTEQPTPFLGLIAADIYVVPPHMVKEHGDDWSLDPATALSCGPFTLETWDKGRQVVFAKNPNYAGPSAAYWQQIVYLIGADEAVFPAYENGEIDLIERGYEQIISPADQARIMSDPVLSAQVHQFPQFQTWWLAFGDQGTPFADVKVRQAFAQAVDRNAIVASALMGQAVPAYGLLPPGFHSSNAEAQESAAYPYDPEAARTLLQEAGFGEGGQPFPALDLTLRDPSPTVQTVAQAIQAMLKENLGVEVGIQSLERKSFTEQLNAHELPFVLIPWDMDYYDASNFMDVFVTGGRHAWSNAEFDALVKEADGIVGDEARRAELYQQAEAILIKDVGGVFLWHPVFTQLWKPYIAGSCLHENRYGILSWQAPEKGPQYYCTYFTNEKPA
ncbi:MAG: peptide ABC transporter substrate-binding protein [Chloroflexia bacterium]|nr:peptide ABC transporter substrate-binding protein [Chloroflexia bacterium]